MIQTIQIDGNYAMRFPCDNVTRKKYDAVMSFALLIRDYKQEVAKILESDFFHYMDMKKLDFVTYIRKNHPAVFIGSCFDKQAIEDVYDMCKNRYDGMVRDLEFKAKNFCGVQLYQRGRNKGKFKSHKVEVRRGDVTITLTHIARHHYGDDDKFMEYIAERAETNKRYAMMLETINKYGKDRLFPIALNKRERMITQRITNKPLEIKSLTFRGRSRKSTIVEYADNYNSVIKAFALLSFDYDGSNTLHLPLKYSKSYHGDMDSYKKKSNDYEYTIIFNEKKKTLKLVLCKKSKRTCVDGATATNYIGIDVNVKHNIFTLSDGEVYDYDRELVNNYLEQLVRMDKGEGGARAYIKSHAIKTAITESLTHLIVKMCKKLQSDGVNHIVMEDLASSFSKSYIKQDLLGGENNINFNRLVKALGLRDIKNIVFRIANKYGIAVSTVHAAYTSKMCSVCGCIDDENRQSQEEFCCVSCGHTANADHNAAINIKNRLSVTVLREKTLNLVEGVNYFEPKKFGRDKLKKILLTHCNNSAPTPKRGRRRNTESASNSSCTSFS